MAKDFWTETKEFFLYSSCLWSTVNEAITSGTRPPQFHPLQRTPSRNHCHPLPPPSLPGPAGWLSWAGPRGWHGPQDRPGDLHQSPATGDPLISSISRRSGGRHRDSEGLFDSTQQARPGKEVTASVLAPRLLRGWVTTTVIRTAPTPTPRTT